MPDAAVVRPSLVYGPGSVSARLFATLASMPVIGLPGRGAQRVQPVHVFELAEAIAALVERTGSVRGVHEIGGADALSYRQMLAAYRTAQGLGDAIWLPLPRPLMTLSAWLAEHVPQRVFSRDTLGLLERGNVTEHNALPSLLGRAPASLAEGLAVTPPQAAFDLHVALPAPIELALRGAIAFLWLQTAIVSAWLPERSGVLDLLARCGFAGSAGRAALVFSCGLNAALGVGTLLRPSVRLYAVQAAAIVGYTLVAAFNVPALTIDHCGPLAKNVPVFACVLTLWLAHATRGENRSAAAPVRTADRDAARRVRTSRPTPTPAASSPKGNPGSLRSAQPLPATVSGFPEGYRRRDEAFDDSKGWLRWPPRRPSRWPPVARTPS